MYIYIYTFIHTYIHIHIYIYIYMCLSLSLSISLSLSLSLYIYIYIYIHTYTYTYIHIHIHYIYMYVYVNTQTCAYVICLCCLLPGAKLPRGRLPGHTSWGLRARLPSSIPSVCFCFWIWDPYAELVIRFEIRHNVNILCVSTCFRIETLMMKLCARLSSCPLGWAWRGGRGRGRGDHARLRSVSVFRKYSNSDN